MDLVNLVNFITAITVISLLAALIGLLLGYAQARLQVTGNPITEQINQLLPQTQCAQCGYPGCRPYAEAIAQGAPINLCPPGGNSTLIALADLLNLEPEPLANPLVDSSPKVAFIREEECIGCTKCIQACPVDAILGAAKYMHTVIASACTGCELCIEPCPVDCIDLITPATNPLQNWYKPVNSASSSTPSTPANWQPQAKQI